MKAGQEEFEYDAFISYSHIDKAFAIKLEKSLEDYKPPKDLDIYQRNLKIFRDEGDLTGSEYYQSIDYHIKKSAKLIVICSPNARKSKLVNDEISRFVKYNGAQNIISIIIDGVPNNIAKLNQEEQKAFPKALCDAMEVPIAANYIGFQIPKDRINAGDYKDSWYTILANIYEISRDAIEQRDKKRQLRRRNFIIGILTAVIISLSILAGFAWVQKIEANKQRDSAEFQLALNRWKVGGQALAAREYVVGCEQLLLAIDQISAKLPLTTLSDKTLANQQTSIITVPEERRFRSINIKFDKNRKYFIIWGSENEAKLFDVNNGEQIGNTIQHNKKIENIVFSQDGQIFLIWDSGGEIHLRNTSNAEMRSPPMKHNNRVSYAIFTKDEKRIVSWSMDGTVRTWDTESGRQITQPLKHDNWVSGTVLSKDETIFLTWSADNTARLWDAIDGSPIGRPMIHDSIVRGAIYTSDESRVLTWSKDGTARLWNASNGASVLPPLKHGGSVVGATFDNGQNRILSWTDSTVVLWKLNPLRKVFITDQFKARITGVLFDQNEERVLVFSNDGNMAIYDAESGKKTVNIMHQKHPIIYAAFTSDNDKILSISTPNDAFFFILRLWDSHNGNEIDNALLFY